MIYKTSEVANRTGIHSNTVRLYEAIGWITPVERAANGYRIFTELHIKQIQMIRLALAIEVLQNGLRKESIAIIKVTAKGDIDKAIFLAQEYLKHLRQEMNSAEEAIDIVEKLLSGTGDIEENKALTRKETADYLNITMDSLRNWELNGLLTVKRMKNGYRIYTGEDIRQLKIIRTLRCANYSLSAILRMLNGIAKESSVDIREVIDTPKEEDDIISVCDELLTSLQLAEKNGKQMLKILKQLKNNLPL